MHCKILAIFRAKTNNKTFDLLVVQAAVDVQGGAGDETSQFGGQIHHGGTDFFGLGQALHGHGINDALALKTSHAGIAMGGIGSDIAVDAADIVLVNDDIRELPHLLRLSRRMMGTIKCNLTFSMALNFIAIILAAGGILNPVAGALVHNAGSVVVIANSVFLLKWRRKNA